MKRSIKSLLYPTTQRAVAGIAILALTSALGMPAPAVAKDKSNGKPVTVNIKKSSKNKTKDNKQTSEHKSSSAKSTRHAKAEREHNNDKKTNKKSTLAKVDKQQDKKHEKTRDKTHDKLSANNKKHAEKVATTSKHAKATSTSHHTSRDTKHDSKKLAIADKKHKTTQHEAQADALVKRDQPATDKHAKRERETKHTSRADRFSKAAELAKLENLKSSARDNNAKLQLSQHQSSKAQKTTHETAKAPPKAVYYDIPSTVGAKQAQASVPKNYQAVAETEAKTPKKAGRALQVGKASYYSDSFDGGRTASGERFDQDKLTCAHGSLPFGCKIRVTNLSNNRSVDVKVNDRGGFAKHGRVVDLSKAAAREIGLVGRGVGKVKIEVVD